MTTTRRTTTKRIRVPVQGVRSIPVRVTTTVTTRTSPRPR